MSMYPEIMCVPMREELTRLGVEELKSADAVDQALTATGTALVVVNSICGCAAGRMRPAVRLALQNGAKPDKAFSVFAGQDKEATERARSYFTGYPPSSPSIARVPRWPACLFHATPRHRIARSPRNRGRSESGIRSLLREKRSGVTVRDVACNVCLLCEDFLRSA